MMNTELEELEAAYKILGEKINAIKAEPVAPVFGRFWDSVKINGRFGWMLLNENTEYPFACFYDLKCNTRNSNYSHFEPITEAILPEPVVHTGGSNNPVDTLSFVFVLYVDGTKRRDIAGSINWSMTESYQLIVKAE